MVLPQPIGHWGQESRGSVPKLSPSTDAFWGDSDVRTTGAVARRVLAGMFLGVVMTLTLAGVAAAQSNSNSNGNSNSNSNSNSGATTTTHATSGATAGTHTTARTGMETWLPLMVGGMVI